MDEVPVELVVIGAHRHQAAVEVGQVELGAVRRVEEDADARAIGIEGHVERHRDVERVGRRSLVAPLIGGPAGIAPASLVEEARPLAEAEVATLGGHDVHPATARPVALPRHPARVAIAYRVVGRDRTRC
jgi:hypothetical protein